MRHTGHGAAPDKTWRWSLWVMGLTSVIWLLLRSGTNPRRLVYPCQRIALMSSLNMIVYPFWLIGGKSLFDFIHRRTIFRSWLLAPLVFLVVLELGGSRSNLFAATSWKIGLPGWTSPEAISDVFVVEDVPVPTCSLDGGKLPATPPCNNPPYALSDEGVDTLLDLLEFHGTPFYATSTTPQGIVSREAVVLIKVNNQWGGKGAGRLASNTDVLKGLIWRILQHPAGFAGEIVVVENSQPTSENDWNATPANAQDQGQTYQDVVAAFRSLGYPVSLEDWTPLNEKRINGGSVDNNSYPQGEYIRGNLDDAYIMLEDPEGTGSLELSYPKFKTEQGRYISLRFGVWDGQQYNADQLVFINLPVLKRHGMAGATGAWKNLIGYTSADGYSPNRFGSYQEMHDFYFGLTGGKNKDYGLLGRQMAHIRAPDLNVIDAIWVAYENNFTGDAVRRDVLLASRDPFAVDWYASEFVLRPITGKDGTSAARSGTFRGATRVNQNAAFSEWPGGAQQYPYVDLLDGYDGSAPADAEKEQMNVFVINPGDDALRIISPNGGERWQASSFHKIRWTWLQDTSSEVQLAYSTDGFKNQVFMISSAEPNDGEFMWKVPPIFSNTVSVRIGSVDEPTVRDESDGFFSITRAGPIQSRYLPLNLNKVDR